MLDRPASGSNSLAVAGLDPPAQEKQSTDQNQRPRYRHDPAGMLDRGRCIKAREPDEDYRAQSLVIPSKPNRCKNESCWNEPHGEAYDLRHEPAVRRECVGGEQAQKRRKAQTYDAWGPDYDVSICEFHVASRQFGINAARNAPEPQSVDAGFDHSSETREMPLLGRISELSERICQAEQPMRVRENPTLSSPVDPVSRRRCGMTRHTALGMVPLLALTSR
jgi:hypothetical protein